MSKRKVWDNKGISPFITALIIVAVVLAVAFLIAYWMGIIPGAYTEAEKLEITSAYAERTTNGYTITVTVKNSGKTDATISNVLILGKSVTEYANEGHTLSIKEDSTTIELKNIKIVLKSGQEKRIKIDITPRKDAPEPFTANVILDIKIRSSSGLEYSKQTKLP